MKMMVMVMIVIAESLTAGLAKETTRVRPCGVCVEACSHKDALKDSNEDKILGQRCPKYPSHPWHRIWFLSAKTHGGCIPLVLNPSVTLHHLQFFIIRTDLYCSFIYFHSNIGLSNLVWKQGHPRIFQVCAFFDSRRYRYIFFKSRDSLTEYGETLIKDYKNFRKDTFRGAFWKQNS